MFRLAAPAYVRLSSEAQMVAELFLSALPPFARRQIRSVRMFGPQARRFEPDAPFDLLVVADERSLEVKTSVSIAVAAVEREAQQLVQVTVATAGELDGSPAGLSRTLQNARREGVDLWLREQARVAGVA
jgi:hypothetical protein